MRWKRLVRDATLAVGAGVAVRAGVAVARKRNEALQEKEIRSRLGDILKKTDWTDDDLKYVLEHVSNDEERLAFTERVHEYLHDESRILNMDEDMAFHLIRNFPTMHVLIKLLEHEKISVINRALREIYYVPEVFWNDWFVKETLRSLPLLLDRTLATNPYLDKNEARFVLLKVFRSNRFRRMKDTDKAVKKDFEELIQKLNTKDDEKVFLDRIYTLYPPDDEAYKIERIRRILDKNKKDIGAEDVNFALEHFSETALSSEEGKRLEAKVQEYLRSMYENEINRLWIKTKVKMLKVFPTIIADYDFLNDKNRIVSEAALSAIENYPKERLSQEVVLDFMRWLQKLLRNYEAHNKEQDGLHNSAEILLDKLRQRDIKLETLWENRLKIDGFPYRF